jgi:hypothetical protein
MDATFLGLSEALTGRSLLNRDLADAYLERVRASPDGANLDKLLAEYESILKAGGDIHAAITTRIMGRDELRKVATVILLLWYFGDYGVGGPAEHYFQGLFWTIISAHPPALSGGYFGHWMYPPDN